MTVNRTLHRNRLVKNITYSFVCEGDFYCCAAFALVVCCHVCLGGSGWVLRRDREKKWPDGTVNSRILAVEFPHFSINALADLSGVVPAFSLVGSDSFLTIEYFLRGKKPLTCSYSFMLLLLEKSWQPKLHYGHPVVWKWIGYTTGWPWTELLTRICWLRILLTPKVIIK